MSSIDSITLTINNGNAMSALGESLAETSLQKPTTIALRGDLGAGKTTLVQGLAKGLGITDRVQSPTFALESRYGDTLVHIDLYRLKNEEATAFLRHSEDFPGIRALEWSERATVKADIIINIQEAQKGGRTVTIEYHDVAIPSDDMQEVWRQNVMLPPPICRHMDTVAAVARACGSRLLAQGKAVRVQALVAAARCHDLLRFVDFAPTSTVWHASADEEATWKKYRAEYSRPHEEAAAKFLCNAGFALIGDIVREHGGDRVIRTASTTIEQLLLAYSDKRVIGEKIVTLHERFLDLGKRYDGGTMSESRRACYEGMQALEKRLFPDGDPLQ